MSLKHAEKLVVAADFKPDASGRTGVEAKVLALAEEIQGTGVIIKINSVLRACGYGLIQKLHNLGLKVCADLKLVDIKNTLETDGALLAEEKPEFLTVMTQTGINGMSALRKCLPETEVWGVTVLTTFDDKIAVELFGCPAEIGVLRFARLAKSAGLGGLILSPKEAKAVKSMPEFDGLTLNSPGIRYSWSEDKTDDQVRFLTAGEAVKNGIHRVVIGRPILNAIPNPDSKRPQGRREAMEWILADIDATLSQTANPTN